MRAWLVLLAACGGGDSDVPSKIEATVTLGGSPSKFLEDCELVESDAYFDMSASDGSVALEIKWRKALITAPGTYPTGGIVDDIVMFAMYPEPGTGMSKLDAATGTVTFVTYEAPAQVTGTFELAVGSGVLAASGIFSCR